MRIDYTENEIIISSTNKIEDVYLKSFKDAKTLEYNPRTEYRSETIVIKK